MFVGLGSVKAKSNGEIEILELNEPNRAELKTHGIASGDAADVVSEMILGNDSDSKTIVHWKTDVNISGQLASPASRLMVPIAQNLAFFWDEVRKKKKWGDVDLIIG